MSIVTFAVGRTV